MNGDVMNESESTMGDAEGGEKWDDEIIWGSIEFDC